MASYLHGVHVPHRKKTRHKPVLRMDVPKTITVPMSMHIGAPATPIVKVGDEVSVTLRFTLKILHKLVGSELVKSYKGVNGGYKLNVSPEKITLKSVIELIDGPIAISRCLESSEKCSMTADKTSCIYHHIFDKISMEVAKKLESITIADVLNKTNLGG